MEAMTAGNRPGSVLLLNTLANRGGAARIAVNLLEGLRASGREAWLAVRDSETSVPGVFEARDPIWLKAWARAFYQLGDIVSRIGATGLGRLIRVYCSHPVRAALTDLGVEPFNYPGSRAILKRLPSQPGLIHAHNLHGWWFDLAVLANWSTSVPVVITLHDAWLMSGHCAHSLGCARWLTGCGECPDLEIYPRVKRDATRCNYRRKRRILEQGRFYLTSPSKWLLDKAARSMLAGSARLSRVIPNGVDTHVFSPGEKASARAFLGIEQDRFIILFVGEDPKESPWRDFGMLRRAFTLLRERLGPRLLLLALGGREAGEEYDGGMRVLPFAGTPSEVARYYRAADAYVHCAKDDTFPTAVLEAMACGLTVVGTAAGGLPEQVLDGETGFLVRPGDHEALAEILLRLEREGELASSMGARGARRVHDNFTVERMVRDYQDWYDEASADFEAAKRSGAASFSGSPLVAPATTEARS